MRKDSSMGCLHADKLLQSPSNHKHNGSLSQLSDNETEVLLDQSRSVEVSNHGSTSGHTASINRGSADFDASSKKMRAKPVTYWSFFLTIPMYVAYAVLLKLQSHLRSHLFVSNTERMSAGTSACLEKDVAPDGQHFINGPHSEAAYIFGLCVSFYYVGCFIFRIGHNLLLGWKLNVSPKNRVVVGYLGMAMVMLLIVCLFYVIFPAPSDGLTTTANDVHRKPYVMIGVLVCYFMAGASFATWEPNVLSTLTPHGHRDKMLAIAAVPTATNTLACTTLLVLGYATTCALQQKVEIGMYCSAAVLCMFGAFIFLWKIPRIRFEASDDDAKAFVSHLKQWRHWVPEMKWCLVAAVLDEITLSMSIAIGQYIYGVDKVPLLYPFVALDAPNQALLDHDHFLVVFFFCGFLGGTISRFVAYTLKERNPCWYILINVLGILCILSKVAIFAPLGMFFIMAGNGFVYASIARYIDNNVAKEYNLVAISVWLCCADIGGFSGANAVVPIHASLGSVGHGVF